MEFLPETMSLRTMWMTVSGQHSVPTLAGAILVYFLAFLICLLLQRSLRVFLPRSLYSYAADFCFTLAICAYPYGHGTVRHLHGHVGYVVAAVVVVTWTCLFFEGTASPLGVFQNYLRGKESLLGLGVRVLLQITAAFLSFRLVHSVWSLEVTSEHKNLMKKYACESDLRVPVVLGCLIEFSSVLYDTWLCHQRLFRSELLDTIVKNINCALLVCAGVHMTGMYMHPAMATGMSWNCRGTSAIEHICVYWIASFCGCYAGGELHSVFHLSSSAVKGGDGDKKREDDQKNVQKGSISLDKSNNNLKQRKKPRASRKEN